MTDTFALPVDIDAERFVLGSILLDESFWPDVSAVLTPNDFSIESHRRIVIRIAGLHDRGEHVDIVTLGTELENHSERQSVGGVTYLRSLSDGLPQVPNIDSYVRTVQEMSVRRRGILAAHNVMLRLADRSEDSHQAIIDGERFLAAVADEQNPKINWKTLADVVAEYPGGLQAMACPPRGGDGISTPWAGITESLSGLHAEDLFIIAGRPGMGKTVAAVQMCHHAAKQGHGAAVFSLEMSHDALYKRLLSALARVDAHRMRAGYLNTDERHRVFEAANAMGDLPIWLDATKARTVPAMESALRRLVAQNKIPKLIMIDHVQLMVGINRKNLEPRLELQDISHATKRMAKEFGATVLLLSQLNRDCERENRRPQLSDLKECGDLEQDADVVMFVHRPEAYATNHGREDLKALAEFIIAKQRSGPTGKRDMIFLAGQQRFEHRAEDYQGTLEEVE